LSRLRLFLEWCVILASALAVFAWASSAGITARLDHQLLDRAAVRSAASASDSTLIVAIDDRSLAAEGQWPWDRAKVAKLIERIDAANPKLIVVDVLYTEPSTPEGDAALARSIAASGRVVLPYTFSQAVNRESGVDRLDPIAELRPALAASGHVAIEPDPDGVVRRLPLYFDDGSRLHPHLQLAAYRRLHGRDPALASGIREPIVPLRPAGAYRTISATSVLNGEVPDSFFTGKVVMIGAAASGLGDSFAVANAVGGRLAGVEIQANLLQALEGGGFIRELPPPASFGPGLAAILLLFLGFWRLRPAMGLALALGLVAALLAGAWLLVAGAQLWFAPGPAMLALIVAYPLWGWRRLSAVSRFLDGEARQLAADEPGMAAQSLGGFDSIAKQVARLDYLVDEVSARRDFLQRVFEAAPDAMLAFDGAGRLQLRNGPARALFAAAGEGSTLAELVESIGGELHEDGEELQLKDGRSFTLSAGPAGEATGLQVLAMTDVTATRLVEAERRAMLEFLSHDMRSPQVAILRLTAASDAPPDRIARIELHAHRTLSLADSFVQLARLAEARLEMQDVELGALLSESVDRAWTAAKASKAAIEWHHDPDTGLWTQADPMVLSRVADNLIGNALKYGRVGGTVRVAAGSNPSGTEIWFSIADAGPGLPAERMADPFRRFGARGDTEEPGSGLGLAFVKTAVERLGGHIAWQSAPGSGTEFTIYLSAA
jgi:CHASE2 domain-containing sensor protein/signal transduction histidine kinase